MKWSSGVMCNGVISLEIVCTCTLQVEIGCLGAWGLTKSTNSDVLEYLIGLLYLPWVPHSHTCIDIQHTEP